MLLQKCDTEPCTVQVQAAFDRADADTAYPNLKASVYFDSLNSQLNATTDDPALIEAFQAFQKSARLVANDEMHDTA